MSISSVVNRINPSFIIQFKSMGLPFRAQCIKILKFLEGSLVTKFEISEILFLFKLNGSNWFEFN